MTSEAWIRLMREQMPFASNRVSSLADAQVNVESIHRAAFERLMAAADEARVRQRGGLGVVLWGDPGVGKSHLLARVAKAIEHGDRGVFLLVHNLLVAPQLIASSLVKCVIAKLTSGGSREPWQSNLYGWLYRQMRQAIPPPRGRVPDKIRTDMARTLFLQHIDQAIERELPEHLRSDCQRVAEVLFAYFIAAYRLHHADTNRDQYPFLRTVISLAVRSLSGEELEPDEWRALGMVPTATAAHEAFEPNDQWLETVLLVLLEMARQSHALIVLCFDQMENLSEERFAELFRFNHALLDHGRNLLIITSGVRSDLLTLREQRLAPEAAWDRLAAEMIDLFFIGLGEARELLRARMESVVAAGRDVPEIAARVRADDLFPLGASWWRARTDGLIEVRPRDVISWAHQRWREQCRALLADGIAGETAGAVKVPAASPPLRPEDRTQCVDERVSFKVRDQMGQLRDDPSSLPPDAGRLVGLLKAALQRCGRDRRWEISESPAKRGVKPTYDVLVAGATKSGERRTIGLAVLVTAHATSAAAAYRRLAKDSSPPSVVIVVRDRRVPESLGAAGEKYRAELFARGAARFCIVEVDFEEFAWLAALEAVLGDSRSGDLEVELPDASLLRVTEQEAEQSHQRRRRYDESPLIRRLTEILTGDVHSTSDATPADGPDRDAAGELSLRDYILGELQLVAGIAVRELAERLHERYPRERRVPLDEFTRLVHDEAQRLHRERRLQATPTSDDLFLLLRP